MISEKLVLRSRYDGLDISVLAVMPEREPVAVLQLAHGMRGRKERFIPFMQFMTAHGIVCVINDHRGHGESVRDISDRGYMYSGGHVALVEDMKMVTDWAHDRFPGLPVYLLGHSMGSLAARVYMKEHDEQVAGIFLCGSPSRIPMTSALLAVLNFLCIFRNGHIRMGMLQRLASRLYNRRFSAEDRNAWTCSDPAVRSNYAADPSCSFDFTANAMYALIAMMRAAYSDSGWKVENPDIPIYFISGDDDPCMRSEGAFHASVQHLADLGYRNVTSALYAGMRHEVLNETGKDVVWNDVLSHVLNPK